VARFPASQRDEDVTRVAPLSQHPMLAAVGIACGMQDDGKARRQVNECRTKQVGSPLVPHLPSQALGLLDKKRLRRSLPPARQSNALQVVAAGLWRPIDYD